MRNGVWAAVGPLMAAGCLVAACGGDTSSGSYPTGSCQTVCDKIATLACPADDPTTCVADCEQSYQTELAQCPSQMAVYLGCLQTRVPLQCGPTGTASADSASVLSLCGSSAQALAACTACNPDPADTTCEACRKTSCCSEWRALVQHPNALAVGDCLDACTSTSTTCANDCVNRFPSYAQAAELVVQCQAASCGC
jgi:hypothetical protein